MTARPSPEAAHTAAGERSDFRARLDALPAAKRALLAKRLAERGAGEVIEPVARTGAIPLSSAQLRLWFMDQLNPGVPLHNMHWAVRMRGAVDVAALRRALSDVVDRHEVLRTTFPSRRGRPEQVILDRLDVPWDIRDASGWNQATVEAHLRQAVRSAFDLATGPLMRALLLHVGTDEHLLVLAIHHIACDGWSLEVLIRELGHCYQARLDGTTPSLPVLQLQYADFAAWQRDWLSSDTVARQMAYWRERLAGVPPALEFPTDRPRPAVQSHEGAYESLTIPADVVDGMRGLCEREGITIFMALLAGFKILLARYTGTSDILVGTPIANRNRVEFEPLVGFLVNTLPLRSDLAGDPTVSELLDRVRETCLAAYANQDVPFEQLVRELAPPRDRSRAPIIQIMFTTFRAPSSARLFPAVTTEPLDVALNISRLDMSFIIGESSSAFNAGVEYNVALYDRATIARSLQDYAAVLRALADGDGRRHVSGLAGLAGAR